MPYSVDRLRPSDDDATAVVEIEAACFGASTLSPQEALRTLSMPQQRLYAAHSRSEGRLVGFCSCFVLCDAGGPRLELDLLAVLPTARGQGLARRMLALALEDAASQGVIRARGVIRVGNRPSERAFARAGLTSSEPSYELLVYTPRGIHPVPYLPPNWNDALSGETVACLTNGGKALEQESFLARTYALTDAGGRLRAEATVVEVHTLGGSALWIEGLQAPSPKCAAMAARGLVERAKRWGICEVGFLAPDSRAGRRMLPALVAEGFERLGRFRIYAREGAPTRVST